ncbi:medium-chain acyl-CoA ligase ACSF2, mitochondrial-like [Physella acuta]|uniref:medium-chain acyl-CoA ligase ACSF2, mitochondrial-like n=1 Tax=Physella acuta TaxID=109671 RepID=UPI0027DBCF0D|nr:medium-chain acyl-CoA ligase ACSF2, mitochondrial-like [Physella acuta]
MGALVSSMEHLGTLPECLKHLSEAAPEKELFVFYSEDGRRVLTALEVYQMSGRFANRLKQEGFQRHDVVCNTLPNSPERVITDLGILFAGCTPMNAHALLADGSDLFHVLKVSKCRAVIVSDEANSNAHKVLQPFYKSDSTQSFVELRHEHLPSLSTAVVVSRRSTPPFLALMSSPELEIFSETLEPSDLAYVFCTSGTTGFSKLVPRTHHEFLSWTRMFLDSLFPGQRVAHPRDVTTTIFDDRLLGWIGGIPLVTLCNGVTRVLMDVYAGPTRVTDKWDACLREKCLSVNLMPRDAEVMVSHATTQGTLNQDVVIATAGQPLTQAQIKKLLCLSKKVFVTYASTETGTMSTGAVSDSTFENFYCGKVSPHLSLKIVNEAGEVCEPGTFGSIHVKGPFVMKKYFNQCDDPDPSTVQAFTPDGWFITGDYGSLDAEGNLYVMGRNRDVIMHGTYFVYPGWIEKKILEHSEVIDVCVVPVSDPNTHHRICACIKLSTGSQLTESDVIKHLKQAFLTVDDALSPVPEYVMIFQDDFPLTHSGKAHREKIRQMAEEKYGRPSS